jgi:hypothetical protein
LKAKGFGQLYFNVILSKKGPFFETRENSNPTLSVVPHRLKSAMPNIFASIMPFLIYGSLNLIYGWCPWAWISTHFKHL